MAVVLSREGMILDVWGGRLAAELTGQSIAAILIPADAQKFLSLVDRSIYIGTPIYFTYNLSLNVRHKTRYARFWSFDFDKFIIYNYKLAAI
ncbi:MAG: hypothetical protein AB1427_00710 [Thermodesulfobacteriota bacterium]